MGDRARPAPLDHTAPIFAAGHASATLIGTSAPPQASRGQNPSDLEPLPLEIAGRTTAAPVEVGDPDCGGTVPTLGGVAAVAVVTAWPPS